MRSSGAGGIKRHDGSPQAQSPYFFGRDGPSVHDEEAAPRTVGPRKPVYDATLHPAGRRQLKEGPPPIRVHGGIRRRGRARPRTGRQVYEGALAELRNQSRRS